MSELRRKILLLPLVICTIPDFAQSIQTYWQQEVNYTIDVSLNDTSNFLTGNISIEYINHSPDTLYFIWFHLWPNAYKNTETAFAKQQLENGNTEFYYSSETEKGYIDHLDFKTDGKSSRIIYDETNID